MRTLLALSAFAALTPARAADPKEPGIGFDYRGLVRDQMRLASEGKLKEAVDLLAGHWLAGTFPEEGKEAMRKRFAAMDAGGGKYLGPEVVGYKKLGSRVYRFYALADFENLIVTFTYTAVRTEDAGWKVSKITVTDGVEEVEKVAPFVTLGPARD